MAFTIPGADILTDIATKDMLSHLRAQCLRNTTLQFDGQIGNTASGVQNIGL
jgi:hypothetical protein